MFFNIYDTLEMPNSLKMTFYKNRPIRRSINEPKHFLDFYGLQSTPGSPKMAKKT